MKLSSSRGALHWVLGTVICYRDGNSFHLQAISLLLATYLPFSAND
jgi:hypothetical protein